ncbi:MAG: ThuA domain-containing protein [Planctomycetota bacterium]
MERRWDKNESKAKGYQDCIAWQKIKAAVPAKATAIPKRPRRLLVFSLCKSYVHSSIPYGKKVIEIMAQKTGTFQPVFTDDISIFEPEKLKQFDAVFLNNNSGELFLPKDMNSLPAEEQQAANMRNKKLQKSLRDFVAGGKGLAAIHCAVWCFYTWPEYANMIGAVWVSHPWHEKVGIKLDDPRHPLCAAFGGKGFDITDEIYVFTDPYSRDSVRVLFSLDMSKTKSKEKFEGQRKDNDYAQSWAKSYGKGRVFYSAFGHDHDIFWNKAVLQHWLDGIQFALGDLPADTTPK